MVRRVLFPPLVLVHPRIATSSVASVALFCACGGVSDNSSSQARAVMDDVEPATAQPTASGVAPSNSAPGVMLAASADATMPAQGEVGVEQADSAEPQVKLSPLDEAALGLDQGEPAPDQVLDPVRAGAGLKPVPSGLTSTQAETPTGAPTPSNVPAEMASTGAENTTDTMPGETPPAPTTPRTPLATSCAEGIPDWSAEARDNAVVDEATEDPNGDVFIAGWVVTGGVSGSTGFVSKYSGETGELLWDQSMSKSDASRARAVAVAPNGNVFVVGDSDGALNVGTNNAAFIAKYGAQGDEVWTTLLTPSSITNGLYDVTLDANGDILAVGSSRFDASTSSALVTKYSASGDEVWTHLIGESDGYSVAEGVATDLTGETVTVVGTAKDTSSGSEYPQFYGFIAQYNLDGEQLMMRPVDDIGSDISDIVRDDDGNFIVVGATDMQRAPMGEGGPFVAKLSPEGEFLWITHRPGNSEDGMTDVAFDPGGNVFVSGLATAVDDRGITLGINALLAKYSPDGELLWEQTIGGDEENYGMAVAVDRYGYVYLGGWEHRVGDTGSSIQSFLTRYR